ncbi:MAG: hypothetical protein J0H35_12920 [Rhodospirillales bacterium]|nr:hypothetical protein [Rhodospirillales bacterium]
MADRAAIPAAATPVNQQGGGSDDLKSREYKDDKGEVHHHSRAYMDQHKGDK